MRLIINAMASLALASVLAVTASAARAQGAGPVTFGLGVGTSVPTGAFGDRVNTGYSIDGSLGYQFRGTPLGIRADVAYSSFGLSDSYLERFQNANDGGANVWSGTVDLTLNLPRLGRVQPYLLGGGGVYRRHVEVDRPVGETIITAFDPFFGFFGDVFTDEATVRSHTQTKFGWNGGAGIAFPVAGVHTFIEARYNDAFTDSRHTGFVPIMIGFRL
jgi:opacity protein-like surface antigen